VIVVEKAGGLLFHRTGVGETKGKERRSVAWPARKKREKKENNEDQLVRIAGMGRR